MSFPHLGEPIKDETLAPPSHSLSMTLDPYTRQFFPLFPFSFLSAPLRLPRVPRDLRPLLDRLLDVHWSRKQQIGCLPSDAPFLSSPPASLLRCCAFRFLTPSVDAPLLIVGLSRTGRGLFKPCRSPLAPRFRRSLWVSERPKRFPAPLPLR